jgi:hypothetical protein
MRKSVSVTMPGVEHPIITIAARRWFDRRYGNTYHSVSVWVDGEHIGRVDMAYGYGEQYLQSAHDLLMAKGFYPKTGVMLASGFQADYSGFLDDMRENRNRFVVTCSDVARKKDL